LIKIPISFDHTSTEQRCLSHSHFYYKSTGFSNTPTVSPVTSHHEVASKPSLAIHICNDNCKQSSENLVRSIHVLPLKLAYVELDLEKAEQTFGDTENFLDFRELKIRKMNKTRKVVGNVTYHASIDNTYIAACSLYKKQGGEYRMMPYTLPKMGYCDFLNSDKYFVRDIVKASNFPYPFPCPFPQVSQHLNFGLTVRSQFASRERLRSTGMKSSSAKHLRR
jgi:hypothetical protein